MDYLLLSAFFVIAVIYASVGFGGGTSYLALMAIWAVPFDAMRPAALLCNIVVVTGGTWIFYREGLLKFREIWPILIFSIPMAFVGGYVPIRENAFFVILGVTLVVAAAALWFQDRVASSEVRRSSHWYHGALIGGGVGFLSGLVSIGGGIFLSPLLHFLSWDHARKISAVASAFILVNSIGGLAGQLTQAATVDWGLILPLAAIVFIGGQVGSRWGARKFNATHIRKVTALLIFVAGMNILFNH
jgi:hypothetical protein